MALFTNLHNRLILKPKRYCPTGFAPSYLKELCVGLSVSSIDGCRFLSSATQGDLDIPPTRIPQTLCLSLPLFASLFVSFHLFASRCLSLPLFASLCLPLPIFAFLCLSLHLFASLCLALPFLHLFLSFCLFPANAVQSLFHCVPSGAPLISLPSSGVIILM